jgi:hypothetical protein
MDAEEVTKNWAIDGQPASRPQGASVSMDDGYSEPIGLPP